MGNARSSTVDENDADVWWTNAQRKHRNVSTSTGEPPESDAEREQRRKDLARDFENFKLELARKHEKRRQILAEKRREMMDTREELSSEKKKNEELEEQLKIAKRGDNPEDLGAMAKLKEENEDLQHEMEKLRLQLKEKEIISEKNKELRISLAEMQKEMQSVNTEVLGFQKEKIDYQEHVAALKDVVKVLKEMLALRGHQIEELRKKITTIEELLASKELNMLSNERRQEYERQLRNIRNLRTLYEERQRADEREKANLQAKIEDLKKDVEAEQQNNRELRERITELEAENSERYDKIKSLESSLGFSKAECKELQAEMAIINQLFSQILLGFNNDHQEIDLNKLIKTLEENHDLLTNIVINEESNEVSALPKVLLDLINQVNEENERSNGQLEKATTAEPQTSAQCQLNSPEEIVENLPKVWRVLSELLSHQCPPSNILTDEDKDHPCYNSIQTPTGTRRVLSVSKTFIRLKDLILEKKFLEKETTRLKHLNTHLEGRLQGQEKRLVLVSSELSKTWHVVGKMQKQHQQLHTQEKILRYELAQKRKLLTELKQELEYCREKWLQARKKNSCTEEQWKQLRSEFTSRKTLTGDECNNSAESGFSDEKSSSEDEDPAFETSDVQEAENDSASIETAEDANSKPCSEITQSGASPADGTKEVQHSSETQKTDLVRNVDQERQECSVLEELGNPETNQETEQSENILQTAEEYIRAHALIEDDGVLGDETETAEFVRKDEPSTSTGALSAQGESSTKKTPSQCAQEFVERREARMQRLEEQCKQLYCKAASNAIKSLKISSKLDNLHETYGENGRTRESTEEDHEDNGTANESSKEEKN